MGSVLGRGIGNQCTLLLTADGGGHRLKDNTAHVGCAVAGFVVSHGVYRCLDLVVMPMPAGEMPEEAETNGLYSALLLRKYFLGRAWEDGWDPQEPDRIAGDSKNTVDGMVGLSRVKHPQLQRWSAGVLAALQDFRRDVDIFAIPRSVNGMADYGAGQAVKLAASLSSVMNRWLAV